MNYRKYIVSEAWRDKRTELFRVRGKKCEICGSKKSIQVHHLTYERLGAELLSDLKVVCKPCHEKIHGKKFTSLPIKKKKTGKKKKKNKLPSKKERKLNLETFLLNRKRLFGY